MGKASVRATLAAGAVCLIFIFAIGLLGGPLWLRITFGAAAMLVWWRYYYLTRSKYVIEERRAREERRSDSDSDV
jgi:hypothetical protein